MLFGKILHRDEAAILLEVIDHRAGDFTAIECVAAPSRKNPQGSGQVLLPKDLARFRGAAIDEVIRGGSLSSAELGHFQGPILGGFLHDWKTVLRVADGRPKE